MGFNIWIVATQFSDSVIKSDNGGEGCPKKAMSFHKKISHIFYIFSIDMVLRNDYAQQNYWEDLYPP